MGTGGEERGRPSHGRQLLASCSWQAQGQSFWQILNQWVWNWRIRAGAVQSPQLCGRQTEWSPALPDMAGQIAASPTETPQPVLSAPNQREHSLPRYGAMTVSQGWAKSRHKYSGKDFKIVDDEFVECPAGHRMGRREIRYTRRGDMQMLEERQSTHLCEMSCEAPLFIG